MTLRPPWKGYSYAVQFSVLLEGVEWESEQKVCFFWISVCLSVKEHSHGDLSGGWAPEMRYTPCAYSKRLIDNPVAIFAGSPSSNMHRSTLMKNFKVWVNFGFNEEETWTCIDTVSPPAGSSLNLRRYFRKDARNANAGTSERHEGRVSCRQVCVTARLYRIDASWEERVSLQSILAGLPASCLVGGLSVLWGEFLGGLAERQMCHGTFIWSWRSPTGARGSTALSLSPDMAPRLTDSLPVGGPMDLPGMEAARWAPRSQAEGLWGPPEDGSGVRKSLLIAAWVPTALQRAPGSSPSVLSWPRALRAQPAAWLWKDTKESEGGRRVFRCQKGCALGDVPGHPGIWVEVPYPREEGPTLASHTWRSESERCSIVLTLCDPWTVYSP